MKKLLLLLLFTGCISMQRTPIELQTKPFRYIYTIEYNNNSYEKGKLWIANTFNSAEKVITYESKEMRIIKGTAVGKCKTKNEMNMFYRKFRYSITIAFRKDKTLIKFDNVSPCNYMSGSMLIKGVDLTYKAYYDVIKIYFDKLAQDYKKSLSNNYGEIF